MAKEYKLTREEADAVRKDYTPVQTTLGNGKAQTRMNYHLNQEKELDPEFADRLAGRRAHWYHPGTYDNREDKFWLGELGFNISQNW